MRVSFNGRTLASQANNVGSIPITRSIFLGLTFKPSRQGFLSIAICVAL
jgi:hypothetical protein